MLLSDSLWQPNAAHQIFEPWIGADRIEQIFQIESLKVQIAARDSQVTLSISPLQPIDGAILVPKSSVNFCNVDRYESLMSCYQMLIAL